jgi:hypothetical protein
MRAQLMGATTVTSANGKSCALTAASTTNGQSTNSSSNKRSWFAGLNESSAACARDF